MNIIDKSSLKPTAHSKIFEIYISGKPYTIKALNYADSISSIDSKNSYLYFDIFINALNLLSKEGNIFSQIFSVQKKEDSSGNSFINIYLKKDNISTWPAEEVFKNLAIALQQLVAQIKDQMSNSEDSSSLLTWAQDNSLILPQRVLLSFAMVALNSLENNNYGLIVVDLDIPVIQMNLEEFSIIGIYENYHQNLYNVLFPQLNEVLLKDRDLLSKNLPIQNRVSIFNALWIALSKLDKLHNFGFFHRDLKPSNILIKFSDDEEDYHAAIADLDTFFPNETIGFINDRFFGSEGYASPELVKNIKDDIRPYYNKYTDIYSSVVLIYETIFGKLLGVHKFPETETLDFNYLFRLNDWNIKQSQRVLFSFLLLLISNYNLLPSSIDKLFYLAGMFLFEDNGLSNSQKADISDAYLEIMSIENSEVRESKVQRLCNEINLDSYNNYLQYIGKFKQAYTFEDLTEARSDL